MLACLRPSNNRYMIIKITIIRITKIIVAIIIIWRPAEVKVGNNINNGNNKTDNMEIKTTVNSSISGSNDGKNDNFIHLFEYSAFWRGRLLFWTFP